MLIARAETQGVSTAEAQDGRLFVFNRWRLAEFMAEMEASQKNEIIVFVRRERDDPPPVVN